LLLPICLRGWLLKSCARRKATLLVRDVAYASLPKARRARAHAEIGKWIEEIAGDRTEEFEELLAYQFRSAVAGDAATRRLLRSLALPTA